jgi:hypothetical protein
MSKEEEKYPIPIMSLHIKAVKNGLTVTVERERQGWQKMIRSAKSMDYVAMTRSHLLEVLETIITSDELLKDHLRMIGGLINDER